MEWKKWRSEGLGASDSPVIMGVSPYKTRYQLWEEKCGMTTGDDGNWATRRGQDLEPVARAQYELMTGLDMPPAFVEHKEHRFVRASLDGWNAAANVVLEIKCPGAEDHALAVAGKIPAKYWPQVQHQLYVTGAERVDYFSFDGKESFARVEVKPDEIYLAVLVPTLLSFWDHVQKKSPPELCEKDFKSIKNAAVKELARYYRSAKTRADAASADLETAKANLLACLDESHPRYRIDDMLVSRVTRQGAIDYGKIPELKGIDLEQFRKKPSVFWSIK